MTINDIKKDLYKSKVSATLNRYNGGFLYYRVMILGGMYEFPIAVTEEIEEIQDNGAKDYSTVLAPDLGTTDFSAIMKASELNRWINKAFEAGKLTLISVIEHGGYVLGPQDNYGDLMTIKEFFSCVASGGFIDDDGSGYWATEKQQSRMDVCLGAMSYDEETDTLTNDHDIDPIFTHVMWYNK